MEMKLMKDKKYFTKGTCMRNYNRFYVEGFQELCPSYM